MVRFLLQNICTKKDRLQMVRFLLQAQARRVVLLADVPASWSSEEPHAYRPSFVLLQCLLLELYLILLPVFILIHCGMGLFCFCFLARKRLILKVLWDDILSTVLSPLWRR